MNSFKFYLRNNVPAMIAHCNMIWAGDPYGDSQRRAIQIRTLVKWVNVHNCFVNVTPTVHSGKLFFLQELAYDGKKYLLRVYLLIYNSSYFCRGLEVYTWLEYHKFIGQKRDNNWFQFQEKVTEVATSKLMRTHHLMALYAAMCSQSIWTTSNSNLLLPLRTKQVQTAWRPYQRHIDIKAIFGGHNKRQYVHLLTITRNNTGGNQYNGSI